MQTRRQFLAATTGAGAALLLHDPHAASATVEMRDRELASLTGGAPVRTGRVNLTIPALAENGLSVRTSISVQSPMTEQDHVKRIHILAAGNPIAHLLTWHLGPRAGLAKVTTNIRLGSSQQLTALAEMSDGTFWQDRKSVVVTVAACIDGS